MLYPDFNELVAFKDRVSDLSHPASRSVKSTVSGNQHSPFRGQGLEFDSVREYVPGDDIRTIDWRVTARTGAPHVKLFKEDRERHMTLCIDMNSSMRFGTRNTFKSVQAARVMALLGWQGIENHDRVGACLFGDLPKGVQLFAPKRTRKTFCTILKMIAESNEEQHHVTLERAMQQVNQTVHNGSLIYLISDFMNFGKNLQFDTNLNQLCKKCDLVFIAINDQADKALFPAGWIRFCAGEKLTINTESTRGREVFAKQWEENREQLHSITSRLKIPLIELTTESDICRELTLGLKYIAKRKH